MYNACRLIKGCFLHPNLNVAQCRLPHTSLLGLDPCLTKGWYIDGFHPILSRPYMWFSSVEASEVYALTNQCLVLPSLTVPITFQGEDFYRIQIPFLLPLTDDWFGTTKHIAASICSEYADLVTEQLLKFAPVFID